MDRVNGVLFTQEKYVEERHLMERFRPSGKWEKSIGKAVGGSTIKGNKLFASRVTSGLR